MKTRMKKVFFLTAAVFVSAVFFGCKSDSDSDSDRTPPVEVTEFCATEKGDGILLTWTDSVSEDVDFYELMWNMDAPISGARSALARQEHSLRIPQGEQNYYVHSLTSGTEYAFVLRAVDLEGNVSDGAKTSLVMGSSNKNPVTDFSVVYEDEVLTLSWKNPDDESFLKSVLTVVHANSDMTETFCFDSSVQSFVWKNGENEKSYEFEIYTVNSLEQKSVPQKVSLNCYPYNFENPVVSVATPESQEITSKTEWIEGASFSLRNAENSEWNFENVSTSIRGRGNSTWAQLKKPYALKLDKKQEILGFSKHKRWVLIANYLDNSFMRNCLAFYLSECFKMDYTVRGDFVNLVLNGKYNGLYWLGEAIKVDENRVDIDEDNDYLIELDVYYDEVWKFKSAIRNMPYMISNDDSMTDERLSNLSEKIEALEKLLYPDFTDGMSTNDCSAPDEKYAEILDVTSWAKFWIINELMDNGELGHPKSCYFTFDNKNGILKAGPVWDFDWASLGQRSSCRLKNTIYYNALFKSPTFREEVKKVWEEYSASVDIDSEVERLRSQICSDQKYDTEKWGEHTDPSGIIREDFNAYVDFLKETLNKKFDVVNAEISAL